MASTRCRCLLVSQSCHETRKGCEKGVGSLVTLDYVINLRSRQNVRTNSLMILKVGSLRQTTFFFAVNHNLVGFNCIRNAFCNRSTSSTGSVSTGDLFSTGM